ncbi:MAG: leucyl aminopeptidase [Proteobacteria bacterium]|nr:leucyl aminopeptidase [Pseudomonadota bacterium]
MARAIADDFSEVQADSPVLEYSLVTTPVEDARCQCVAVPVAGEQTLSEGVWRLDEKIGGPLRQLAARGQLPAEPGDVLQVPVFGHPSIETVIAVGTGVPAERTADVFARVAEAAIDAIVAAGVRTAALYISDIDVIERDDYWRVRQAVVTADTKCYRFRREALPRALENVFISGSEGSKEALEHGIAMAAAMRLTRSLADTPPNVCTPSYLADVAIGIGRRFVSVSTSVIEEQQMEQLGMGAILSVGRGSCEPSKLLVLTYSGARSEDPPIVLIGKGITFDTGGNSIKPLSGMKRMKYDMCGAASTLAAVAAAARLDLPLNVVGVAACAENMPGATATRPGDVVSSLSGKSVEIINPDAEGRLVLCDALTYVQRFGPAAVIDIATLTSASLVALGRSHSALMANDQELADALSRAGESALDRAWQLPLPAVERKQLASSFADLRNIGDGTAACIVAGMFLAEFAESYSWAHLDVSNTAKLHGEDVGATGRPTMLLLEYLLDRAGKDYDIHA